MSAVEALGTGLPAAVPYGTVGPLLNQAQAPTNAPPTAQGSDTQFAQQTLKYGLSDHLHTLWDSIRHSDTVTSFTGEWPNSKRFSDASHYDGAPNWKEYFDSGRRLAVVKATQGTDTVDPQFARNQADIRQQTDRSSDRHAAYYHFPGHQGTQVGSPEDEANAYLKTVGTLGPHEFPVLDWERPDGMAENQELFGMAPQQQADWIQRWMSTVQEKTRKTPWLYSNESTLNHMDSADLSGLHQYPLWMARSQESADPHKPLPTLHGWSQLSAWQYTDHGHVLGIPGDDQGSDDNFLYTDLH